MNRWQVFQVWADGAIGERISFTWRGLSDRTRLCLPTIYSPRSTRIWLKIQVLPWRSLAHNSKARVLRSHRRNRSSILCGPTNQFYVPVAQRKSRVFLNLVLHVRVVSGMPFHRLALYGCSNPTMKKSDKILLLRHRREGIFTPIATSSGLGFRVRK